MAYLVIGFILGITSFLFYRWGKIDGIAEGRQEMLDMSEELKDYYGDK